MHLGSEGLEIGGVGVDEFQIQQARRAIALGLRIALQHMLDDALDRGQIAADLELEIIRGDAGGAVVQHLQLVLRVGELLQPAFAQRIECRDRRAALGGLAQLAEHARMIGARVLAEDEDCIGQFEVVQRHRALAHADLRTQRGAGRLVAHVGAVREVVGAKLAHEQLVQEGRFVAGAPGGVEDRLVRRCQPVEVPGDLREGRVPAHRHVVIGGGVVTHRLGQPALPFQPVVAVLRQQADAVRGKQLRPGAARRGFGGNGLGAVLAELEGGGVVAVGPGAAGAVETVRLVGMQQRLGALHRDVLFHQVLGDRAQCAPAAGGIVVLLDGLLAHAGSPTPTPRCRRCGWL